MQPAGNVDRDWETLRSLLTNLTDRLDFNFHQFATEVRQDIHVLKDNRLPKSINATTNLATTPGADNAYNPIRDF